MKKFNQFINENVRDKMIPKDLSPDAKLFWDAVEDIKNLGYNVEKLNSKNGLYEFTFIDEYIELNNKYITVKYDSKNKWTAEIYYGRTKSSTQEKQSDLWTTLLNDILNELYPNIDVLIENTEKEIEDKNIMLVNLNKIKNIKI